MRKKNIIITPYLDPSMVEDIYHTMGQAPPGKSKANTDGIDEDINEEI